MTVEHYTDDQGRVAINSIEIPEEFVTICGGWYRGMDLLYAVASTGGLTLGSIQPHDVETEQEWYHQLWSGLSADLRCTIRPAKKVDTDERGTTEDVQTLEEFETWIDEEVLPLLESSYGIE